MPWTVNSEIYPLWARSTGNACSSGVNWVFNVLVSLTFLHTAEYLTYYGKKQYASVCAVLPLVHRFSPDSGSLSWFCYEMSTVNAVFSTHRGLVRPET